MIVSVNGRFDLRNEDEYTATNETKSTDDKDQSIPEVKNKLIFLPAPPTEPKQRHDGPHRPFPIRPKSSDSAKRTNTNQTKISSGRSNKTETKIQQRAQR